MAPFPSSLELGPITLRIVAVQKLRIALDARGDEIIRRIPEHGAALFAIALKQGFSAPALHASSELPAQIDDVFETIVQPKATIGRMRMRGITCNENASTLVLVGHRHAHLPEGQVFEIAFHRKAGGLANEAKRVEGFNLGFGRHRCVEEPAIRHIDTTEKLPIAIVFRTQDAIGRAFGKTLQLFVEIGRAENGEQHGLIVILRRAVNADLVAHSRACAIATHQIRPRNDARIGAIFARHFN